MRTETDILPPRYTGSELIGRGGMADIYRATDGELGRVVAVKVLADRHAADDGVSRRFEREARAAARLSGEPGTVTIFDVGEWNGRPFIVMEYLAGGSLQDRLRDDGAQPIPRTLSWLEQAGRALDAAHAKGVVHRDVKPGNLLLDPDGGVHVADFGIAIAAGLDSFTQTGTVLGTAAYLSPEQAQGQRATAASDVYALGLVGFELLTGERPYESDSTTAEAAAHVHAPVPSVSERRRSLPGSLDPVFERVLAKEPNDRFPSCSAFVSALRAAVETGARSEPFVEAPTRALPPSGRSRRRIPAGVPIAAALVLLAGAAGIVGAALLTDGGGGAGATTLVKTVREQARTETVTTASPPPPAPEPPPPPPAVDGAALNDQGFALMQQGDYERAEPLLARSVQSLAGSGELVEAYASYNLAFTRFELGRCDGVLELLDRSEEVQGERKEIDKLRRRAEKRCEED